MDRDKRNNTLSKLIISDYAYNFSKHLIQIYKYLPGYNFSGEDIYRSAIEFQLKAYLTYQEFDYKESNDLGYLLEICTKYDSDFNHFKPTDFYFEISEESSDEAVRAKIVERVERYLVIVENFKRIVLNKTGFSQQDIDEF